MSKAASLDETRQHATYSRAVDHLYALGQELAPLPPLPDGTPAPRRKWDLAHMRTLCAALGDPQNTFPSVLIAGTNGKGSTSATLASILAAAGYKTALYTSPHLSRVNERIQILDGTTREESVILSEGAPAPESKNPRISLEAPEASNGATNKATYPGATAAPTEIPDSTFARLYFHVDDTATRLVSEGTLPHPPSFFEVLTALAFLYFAEEKVDIAVLEVGLGGRLDATNIVEPLLSVITDIALDHQEFLGNTIAEIAREKAGILRPNGLLVTLPQHPESNQSIGEAAMALNVTGINAAAFLPPQLPSPTSLSSFAAPGSPADVFASLGSGGGGSGSSPRATNESAVTLSGAKNPRISPEAPHALPRNQYTVTLNNQPLTVDSPLSGHHQQRNIALAIAAAETLSNLSSYKLDHTENGQQTTDSQIRNSKSYKIEIPAIEAGIRNIRWPGRLEFVEPNLLLDVAHNPAGAWTLRAAIARLPEDQPRTLLFSCLGDKDLTEMSRILFPLFDPSPGEGREKDHIVLAPIANPRAANVEDLLAAAHALDIPAHAAPHLEAALAQARAVTPAGGLIIATGSVYLVGAIRDLALQEPEPN